MKNTIQNSVNRRLLLSLIGLAAMGCGDTLDGTPTGTPPSLGVSSNALVVGETLEIYVKGLPEDSEEDFQLMFAGQYFADDGSVQDVRVTQPALLDGKITRNGEEFQVLRLSRFGPFSNPFSDTDRPGRFEGTVAVMQSTADGMLNTIRAPSPIEITVDPSIIIDEFQPIEADCGAPALRALPGLAYRLSVRAVGIKPVKFTYRLSRINGAPGFTEYVHVYDEPVAEDRLGEGCTQGANGECESKIGESIIFNQIAAEEHFYATVIRVFAEDANGRQIETALPMTVHRPIEVRMASTTAEVAERYAPVPVSGCMTGGIETRVAYRESKSESRQKSVSMVVNRDFSRANRMVSSARWQEGISEGESTSARVGVSTREEERTGQNYGVSYNQSEANDVGYSTTDGESWSWSDREGMGDVEYEDRVNKLYGSGSTSTKVGVSGEGSVPGFAKVSGSASTTVGVTAGGSLGQGMGSSRSRNHSRGHSASGTSSENRAFGSTVNEGSSREISGSYALSNSRGRSQSETSARDASRTWSMSGSTSNSELVSEGRSESEQSTWSSTTDVKVITQFFGSIPLSKVGMFYRQTTRLVKRAEVRAYNKCGLSEQIGELQFNEWEWAPALALANTCDDGDNGLLPVDLPPAECRIEPCDVQ